MNFTFNSAATGSLSRTALRLATVIVAFMVAATVTPSDRLGRDFTPIDQLPEYSAQIGGSVRVGAGDPRRSARQMPMRGAQVGLFRCDGHFVEGAITDSAGAYRFGGLTQGCYRVRVRMEEGYRFVREERPTLATVPWQFNPSTGTTGDISLELGEQLTQLNVNIVPDSGAQLGDRVWRDINANGQQDIGEPGLSAVETVLLTCSGEPVLDPDGLPQRDVTDSNGDYLFSDLKPGCYVVRFSAAIGTDWVPGSIVNSEPTMLEEAQSDYSVDQGFYQSASLGNRVWHDLDRNGLQSKNEPGRAGVQVLLLDAEGVPAGPVATTDANGFYSFQNLSPGRYMLQFVLPGELMASPRDRGDNDGLDSDANSMGLTESFELNSAERDFDFDLGLMSRLALGVSIEKSTNGSDADSPPGPFVAVGDDVLWEYTVHNTGTEMLFFVTVTDDQGVVVTCPQSILNVEEQIVCTGSTGTAQAGQYVNVATVVANDGSDDPIEVEAVDSSHYFGALPAISMEKTTNGQDADTLPGPDIAVGEPIDFRYNLENTGNVTLTNIQVSDDQGVVVLCPADSLDPGQTMQCSGAAIATFGPYTNIGTVVADTPLGTTVSDSDPSNHTGRQALISIEKFTEAVDADLPPGPEIGFGSEVNWAYVVTNEGNVLLTDVEVTDDQGVQVICETTLMQPGETQTCFGIGTAIEGQYANIGQACGEAISIEQSACDTDPSHYMGIGSGISLDKFTSGLDADTPTGPFILVGNPVDWTYRVTNTGGVVLSDITVTDSQGVQVNCPPEITLDPGESVDCTASGTATLGQYMNIGEACASGNDDIICTTDPSHYFGAEPAIEIEKSTNGEDADLAPGPTLAVGAAVDWTYRVTNSGNVELVGIEVTDDQGVTVTCPLTSLQPGESMDCTGSGIATVGQYQNTGSVCAGITFDEGLFCDSDPSHYLGGSGEISIEKSTNGQDADAAPGPFIQAGETVSWSYVVTNSGDLALSNVSVTDNQGVVVDCPMTTLGAGASMTCTGSGTATAGQYANLGMASGTPPGGSPVTASDPSHYFGEAGGITVEKATNGEDADLAPGPSLALGSAVNWTYVITNDSNVTLTGVTVSDDQGVAVSCPMTTLAAGATMTCTGSGTAAAGQYANIGTVTATTPGGATVTDDDPSHYFGEAGGITVEKATNGEDADLAPGPSLALGSAVNWTYVITNDSNVTLTGVTVSDDQGVAVSCPMTTLAAGATMTCTGSGIAAAGQYANIGTVTATTPGGATVTDDDPSHYFGEAGGITVEKATNGEDADSAPGPFLVAGSAVNWTYVIVNTGNTAISNISVSDDQGVTVTCPLTTLAAGATMTCTGSGTATAGQYANIGTVTATTPGGTTISDDDPSHYFGESASLLIEKSTNGEDADSAPGPFVAVGDAVNWLYSVTNNGNVTINNIVVSDDQGVSVTCPATSLAPGLSFDCTASGIATAGQYQNTGTAEGTTPAGVPISESDPSHYFGSDASLTLEKTTNGEDADVAPGPSIAFGQPVEWRYILVNTGNVTLTSIVVTDDQGVAVTCPATLLVPQATMTCTGSGVAIAGQYMNIGTATGVPPTGGPVTASDPSHYFGDAVCVDKFVADNFNHVAYDNNDGDMDWSGPWKESDALGGGASSGSVRVGDGRLVMNDYPDSGTQPNIRRSVDLSGFAAAMLMFDWSTSRETLSNDVAVVEISRDGGASYTVLGTFTGTGDDDDANGGFASFDISDYITANTLIRFRIKQKFGGRWDKFMVDNVRIDKKCVAPDCVVTSASTHGLWLANFNDDGHTDRFDFDPGAAFSQFPDGTALLTGTVRLQGDTTQVFQVRLDLAGRTDTPPPGSPKNTFGADPADWEYYPDWTGTLIGSEAYDGAEVAIIRRGPAFQIGTGAGDQPGEQDFYGGSGWFDTSVVSQAQSCVDSGTLCIADGGFGDVNVRIDCNGGDVCTADESPHHAFYFFDFNDDGATDRYDIDTGSFVRNDDGSARLIGEIFKRNQPSYRFAVDVQFSGRTVVPPAGSPYNPHNADPADWVYYPQWSGVLVGTQSNSGAAIVLERRGAAFQVGTGANAQSGEQGEFGASGWFDWSVNSQPSDCNDHGDCIAHNGDGDINIRLDCPD